MKIPIKHTNAKQSKFRVGDQVVYTKPGSDKRGMDGDVQAIRPESASNTFDEMLTVMMSDGSTITMYSDYFKKIR